MSTSGSSIRGPVVAVFVASIGLLVAWTWSGRLPQKEPGHQPARLTQADFVALLERDDIRARLPAGGHVLPAATMFNADNAQCGDSQKVAGSPRSRDGQLLADRCYTSAGRHLSPPCAAFIVPRFASEDEVHSVGAFAEAVMRLGGGSSGGVTLVDAHMGVVSSGKRFVNLFHLIKAYAQRHGGALPYDVADAVTYRAVVRRIHELVQRVFLPTTAEGSQPLLYLASPAFISLMTNTSADTPNDEYWHSHVDIDQYPSFDVTTLLYLTSSVFSSGLRTPDADAVEQQCRSEGVIEAAGADDAGGERRAAPCFCGGRFVFLSRRGNESLGSEEADDADDWRHDHAPALGDLLVFTSGAEHPHRVERVTCGYRMAMTTAFTCDGRAKGAKNVLAESFLKGMIPE